MTQAPDAGGARGSFITFEGVEGAGKTTRSLALVDALAGMGFGVSHTREPGGTPLAEGIRRLLLDPSLEVPPAAELMLYLASRAANVECVVRPALAAGRIVVCERYSDATLAYQVSGRGLDGRFVEEACGFATGGLAPDLTILLDLDPESGMARLGTRAGGPDRIEREDLDFHRRVRNGYLAMAGGNPRFRVVDASLPAGRVDAMILDMVVESLGLRNGNRAHGLPGEV